MKPSIVVFDLGNVLVDWKPHQVWMEPLGSFDAVEAFLQRIDFSALNLRCDAGETFTGVSKELAPEDAALLMRYVDHFHLSVADQIPGTWDIVGQLEARNVPLHAITNWSAETWPKVAPALRP